MKRHALWLLATTSIAACGSPPSSADAGMDSAADAVPPAVHNAVARIGEEAAQALRAGLSARLAAAVGAGGPVAAIDVCALEALPLTDSIARAAPTGVVVKRTSLRIRNPHNSPDSLELAALRWFAERDADRPTSLVQPDGGDFRYYAPLRVAAQCTACHGAADALAPSVREALRQRYPQDRATGYAEGELRGLIRVSVPAAAVSQ